MDDTIEQRSEQRLNYNWPMRFALNHGDILFTGKMIDISSYGSAFVCDSNESPQIDQQIITMFSVPRFGRSDYYDMANYSRLGRVCRVDSVDDSLRKVAVQFTQPLFFKPGHQDVEPEMIQQRLNIFQ
jgi:hypothetical protein